MKDYIQKIVRVFASSKHEEKEKVTMEVHQWLLDSEHADEKEAALNSLWEETEAQADAGTWKSLENVYRKLGVEEKSSNENQIKIWRYVAAAVVILTVSVSGTFYFTKNAYSEVAMVEKFTQDGDMNKIELPDGSMVQTNSGTLLLYPKTFKGDTRTVYLIGEANFKVKKNPDKPFIVKSTTMSVTALGTEFNVAAYPESGEIVATLINGKIKVECDGEKQSYTLIPGQQITYSKNNAKCLLSNANLEEVTAWQKGLFVFKGDTMKEILNILERRFNITFQCNISGFSDDKYNFRFRQNANIEEIMGIMQEVVGGFNYKIEGNICYIKLIK